MSSITIPRHAKKFYALQCGGEKITRAAVEGLTLTQLLADRQGVKASTIVRKVWRAQQDTRRLFTKMQRELIVERDACTCAYCGSKVALADIKIDHVIPHAAGGQTVVDNGAVSCTACNLNKSSKVW